MRPALGAWLLAAAAMGCAAPQSARLTEVTRYVRQNARCAGGTVSVDEVGENLYAIADCHGGFGVYRCDLGRGRYVDECRPDTQGTDAWRQAIGDWAPVEAMSERERETALPPAGPPVDASAAVAPSAPVPPPMHPDDATIRATLDALAPSILACVASGTAAVRATWDVQCQMSVSLHGAGAGSDADACVQATTRRTVPCSSPGTLLHVVGAPR